MLSGCKKKALLFFKFDDGIRFSLNFYVEKHETINIEKTKFSLVGRYIFAPRTETKTSNP